MKIATNKTLGGRLKNLRTSATLSQEQLVQKLFLSRSSIANYEADLRQLSMEILRKLSD